MVKTIEQILGVPPMNQEDRAAEPIRNAFMTSPNFTPYTALPNQIPLTYGLKTTTTSAASRAAVTPQADGTTAGQTVPSAATVSIPSSAAAVARQWQVWSSHQNFGGSTPDQDRANPAQLNHLDWYAATNWSKPYPGEPRILGPYQVPGWDRPAAELGGG